MSSHGFQQRHGAGPGAGPIVNGATGAEPMVLDNDRDEDVEPGQHSHQPRNQGGASDSINDRIRSIKRREPFKRSRKEELEAYGRAFVGCGKQGDYGVTTKLGEGTFGEVHKAIHKTTGAVVALKRILMHNEKEGMPVTALREIKILKALKHACVVEILDMFVVRSELSF